MCTRHPHPAAKAADAKQEVDELTQRLKELELDLNDLDAEERNEALADELRQRVEELEAELDQRKQTKKD